MMLYICTKFHENMYKGFIVNEGLVFPYSGFSKGHNSVKNIRRYMAFFSAYLLTMLYICTNFHENICKGFSELFNGQDFQFFKFSKGNNSVKI